MVNGHNVGSRSHMPEGVKTKRWEDRMQKTQKEKAIKQLQTELKEEKQAEIRRFVTLFSFHYQKLSIANMFDRRKEITAERKKAAEERRRLEEDKAKVKLCKYLRNVCAETFELCRWAHGKQQDYAGRQDGQRKLITDQIPSNLFFFCWIICSMSCLDSPSIYIYCSCAAQHWLVLSLDVHARTYVCQGLSHARATVMYM